MWTKALSQLSFLLRPQAAAPSDDGGLRAARAEVHAAKHALALAISAAGMERRRMQAAARKAEAKEAQAVAALDRGDRAGVEAARESLGRIDRSLSESAGALEEMSRETARMKRRLAEAEDAYADMLRRSRQAAGQRLRHRDIAR